MATKKNAAGARYTGMAKKAAASEGPKRSVKSKPRGVIRQTSRRPDGLGPKTTTSLRMAKLEKKVADILTGIPGVQDRNSGANKNWRKSANRTLVQAKAQEGAKKAGNTARSQMAVTRSRRSRPLPKKK